MSHPTTTTLADRMKLHIHGQITWPEPALGKHCDACRFFYTGDLQMLGRGRCDLVRLHSNGKSPGVGFMGTAIACPQFDAGEHKGNRTK